MAYSRRLVLAALLAAVTAVTAAIISGLLVTVFFAITVAYVFVPYHRWLGRQGLPRWAANTAATGTAFLGGFIVLLPLLVALYVRRAQLLALIRSLPDRFAIEVAGFSYAVVVSDLTAFAARSVTRVAIDLARATPIIAAKAVVFAFVVYALLDRRDRLRGILLDPFPREYHDVAIALHERTSETLYALYVIQAATSLGTFLVAVPLFALLGYPYPITLGVFAGVLQFLPVVGPSVVVLGLAAFDFAIAAPVRGTLVLVFGLSLVAFLPDAALRPRLARDTARLPASLYFVGFTGGVLSLGPVGVIAGPLSVALLAEVLSLLADEMAAGGP